MTTNSAAPTDAPKRRQKASKKNKKSWRKNTNLEDVDEFLDDKRLEERLGGAFGDRPDSALFFVEKDARREEEETTKPLSRLEARKRRAEKPLKCFQQLENTSKVADPKKGRNSRRLPEERENPIVKDMNKRMREQGIVRMKKKKSSEDKAQYAANRKATQVERLTRRRTKFDFDLWDDLPKDASAEIIKTDEWLDSVTKGHVLKNSGKLKRKVPEDFHRTLSALPSIELPHGGMSYNPSYKDHQALLFRAAVVEMNKEKEQNRIEYHTTRMFPKAGDAPTAESWLKEMSEGLKKADEAEGEPASEGDEAEDAEDAEEAAAAGASNKLKTRKQRRKAKELMAEKRRLQRLKANKLKNEDVFLLKAMKKNLNKEDVLLQGRLEKRRLKKEESMLTPALLSKHKFEEPEIDLKLSDELTGNLRSLRPEGNILQDRFKSMQKRNVFEPTVKEKAKKQKKKLKRKIFERKSYKLPGHSLKK